MNTAYHSNDFFQLFHGDSLELLKTIPDESVDMIFADPPYFLSNGGFSVQSGKQVSVNKGEWDKSKGFAEDFNFMSQWIAESKRILKKNGTIWISGTYHSIYTCGYALLMHEFKILNDISWFKPNGAPNLSGRFFTASHENLIWAKPHSKEKHTFNYAAMKEGKWPSDTLKKPGKQMRSVWSIPTPAPSEKKHGKHPTQKPLALLERIVLASTNEGDVILDPFNGSGTTGLAALKHNRKYIGMEKTEEYLKLTLQRLEAHLNQPQLLA